MAGLARSLLGMTAIEVDPAGLTRNAASVCQIAEDLRLASSAWAGAVDAPAFDVAVSASTVREVWQAELKVYQEVLEQWCLATRAVAAGYKTVDAYVAAGMRP